MYRKEQRRAIALVCAVVLVAAGRGFRRDILDMAEEFDRFISEGSVV